ncbi:hypothetical protein [Neobacillus soli]|uniref:hypothetical protein n=1 Tax=Neobacillus soli TaxID=220688 RepID=UPI000B02E4FD|nr:hypothetical protein [Neobacillus soli]
MSPINTNVGIAPLSGKKDDLYLLRLYQLIRRKERKYLPTYEIEAFRFAQKNIMRIC